MLLRGVTGSVTSLFVRAALAICFRRLCSIEIAVAHQSSAQAVNIECSLYYIKGGWLSSLCGFSYASSVGSKHHSTCNGYAAGKELNCAPTFHYLFSYVVTAADTNTHALTHMHIQHNVTKPTYLGANMSHFNTCSVVYT